jgi:hypothetical protein
MHHLDVEKVLVHQSQACVTKKKPLHYGYFLELFIRTLNAKPYFVIKVTKAIHSL